MQLIYTYSFLKDGRRYAVISRDDIAAYMNFAYGNFAWRKKFVSSAVNEQCQNGSSDDEQPRDTPWILSNSDAEVQTLYFDTRSLLLLMVRFWQQPRDLREALQELKNPKSVEVPTFTHSVVLKARLLVTVVMFSVGSLSCSVQPQCCFATA